MRTNLVAVVGLAAALAAGCGSEGTVGSSSGSTSATSPLPGASAPLVLRISVGGGLLPPQYQFGSLPAVSLYADGTVITVGPTTLEYPGRALPNVLRGSISRDNVRALLAAARDAGVRAPAPDFGRAPIADAPTTTFYVRDEAGETTVSAYALAEATSPSGLSPPQLANRRQIAAFRDRAMRAAERSNERYAAASLAVLIAAYPALAAGDVTPTDQDWPGTDLGSRPSVEKFGLRCITVEGAELARVAPVVQKARANARWHSGARAYQLTFRPELPDEHLCRT
jgi:hypothetical protein